MTEEENIQLLNLARVIDKFVTEHKEAGWYAPDLAKVIIEQSTSPSPDKVREILKKYLESPTCHIVPDVKESIVNEICGG